jgi:hypothetical protein
MLNVAQFSSASLRTRVVAGRIIASLREPAWFAEKIALAEAPHCGGIKHPTVRNEPTPRMRAASTIQLTQTTGRKESLLRVPSSRLSSSFPQGPSRSDRPMDECSGSEEHIPLEDQGGQG